MFLSAHAWCVNRLLFHIRLAQTFRIIVLTKTLTSCNPKGSARPEKVMTSSALRDVDLWAHAGAIGSWPRGLPLVDTGMFHTVVRCVLPKVAVGRNEK